MSEPFNFSLKSAFVLLGYVVTCILLLFVIYQTYLSQPINTETERAFIEIATTSQNEITVDASPDKPLPAPQINSSSTLNKIQYIEVTDGCGPYFDGSECLNVRSGPGVEYPVVTKLRNGIVLRVDTIVKKDGMNWYKISFDEWLRYPERITSDWYVAEAFVRSLFDTGEIELGNSTTTTNKQIIVDRSSQMLTAYENDEIIFQEKISTGLDLSPTPRGEFIIFRKTPTRYMQGPLPNIPGSDYYDLPGVPWNLYFTAQGAVIHGAYWHKSFGKQYSHGCVNLPPVVAEALYHWADVGTKVIVRD